MATLKITAPYLFDVLNAQKNMNPTNAKRKVPILPNAPTAKKLTRQTSEDAMNIQ